MKVSEEPQKLSEQMYFKNYVLKKCEQNKIFLFSVKINYVKICLSNGQLILNLEIEIRNIYI